MFQRILDLLIIILAIEAAILGVKWANKKTTMQGVPAPSVCGAMQRVLVEGGTSPKPPSPDDVSSPVEPPWFNGPSKGGEDFFSFPILNPTPRPRRAIRRVVRNTDWQIDREIRWEDR